MSALYAESSAVLAVLLEQGGGAACRVELDKATVVVSSRLTRAEVGRVLVRLAALGKLSAGKANDAWSSFLARSAHWLWVPVDCVLDRVEIARFPREPVRVLDAIHLEAIALVCGKTDELVVLSTDERVKLNALARGQRVLP